MTKLTKAQRSLLELCVADSRGIVGVVPYYTPAKILVSRGLAAWRDNDPYSGVMAVTEAGRSLLTQKGE